MSTRLIPCPACKGHVMESDASCPHCGEALRAKSLPRPGWVLFSLALAGCPSDDVYGAPDTGPAPTTESETENSQTGETAPNETGEETSAGETG